MHMYLQSHVTCQVIGHVRAGEWPWATTPCAPLEQGDALVACKTKTKQNKTKKKNCSKKQQNVKEIGYM